LPASYHYCEDGQNVVADPTDDIPAFVQRERSLGCVAGMKYIWIAGVKRPAKPLYFHVAIGREIAVADWMDLHLVWDIGRRLLLSLSHTFSSSWTFGGPASGFLILIHVMKALGTVAVGFLYTYVCLVSSESNFYIANRKRHYLVRKTTDRSNGETGRRSPERSLQRTN
jgi:hypothetical protein